MPPVQGLWIITKTAAINPSYYAPEFYENCCPEKQRGLFRFNNKKNCGILLLTMAE